MSEPTYWRRIVVGVAATVVGGTLLWWGVDFTERFRDGAQAQAERTLNASELALKVDRLAQAAEALRLELIALPERLSKTFEARFQAFEGRLSRLEEFAKDPRFTAGQGAEVVESQAQLRERIAALEARLRLLEER